MPQVISPCGGSGGGGSDLPTARMTQLVSPFADSGFNLSAISFVSSPLETNDATVFASGTSGGTTTIKVLTTGTYMAWATVRGELTSPPAAGSYLQVYGTCTFRDPFDESRWGDWHDTDGFGDYEAGATNGILWIPDVVPGFFFLRAGQNSGSNIQLHATITIVRTSPIAIA